MTQPYTHAIHAKRCHQAALDGRALTQQLVQVKLRSVVYCARIHEAWTTSDGLDLWTVITIAPEARRMSIPVSQVRLCGGFDGRCTCSGAPTAAGCVASEQVSGGVRC